MKKVIIAGSRGFKPTKEIEARVDHILSTLKNITIISGTAAGADRWGEAYAKKHGYPVERYPADWDRYGKSAGYRRNEVMAKVADCAIIMWDGQSRGSKHMIDIMKMSDKPYRVIIIN